MSLLPFPSQHPGQAGRDASSVPGVLWLHGLSGSGKSTLARAVAQELAELGVNSFVLDGDSIRRGLNKDLGLSEADRKENVRRTAEVARLMAQAGVFVISAFITPYEESRDLVRQTMRDIPYAECHVRCSLPVCMYRDPKGLYARARAGEIQGMTGLGAPFEDPRRADMVVRTEGAMVQDCVRQVLRELFSLGLLPPWLAASSPSRRAPRREEDQETTGMSSQQVV